MQWRRLSVQMRSEQRSLSLSILGARAPVGCYGARRARSGSTPHPFVAAARAVRRQLFRRRRARCTRAHRDAVAATRFGISPDTRVLRGAGRWHRWERRHA